MTPWSRLSDALAALPAAATVLPAGGRIGAAMVLVADPGDGDLEIVFTRRRDDLAQHPGQISFPGGRLETGETIEQAALREAREEVGLDPATVEVLGRLPAFYIPPSRFWFQAVCGRWHTPHALVPQPSEVAEILQVRLAQLRDPAALRVVELSSSGWSWAWALDDDHILWGATAVVTAVLLGHLDPGWAGGRTPADADLVAERAVRPWAASDRVAPRPGRPRLPGVPEIGADAVAYAADEPGVPDDRAVRAAGSAVADAVVRLRDAQRPGGRVAVLAGHGLTGAVGLVAAAAMADQGVPVHVVLDGAAVDVVDDHARAALARLGAVVAPFDGTLDAADVVVDALVGAGLRGPLRGTTLGIVHALRLATPAVLSVDVPTGLHPRDGLIGDMVTADVTVALGAPLPALFAPGMAPFVGDLYLADLRDGGPLVRLVAAPSNWAE